MFDIFEQYWTLLITAVIACCILDARLSDRHSWWQWILLILLLVASYVTNRFAEAGSILSIVARIIITVGVALLLGWPLVPALRSRYRYWWLWLLPPCLAVAAFACDWLVKTDLEKINIIIKTGIKAVEEENPAAVDAIIAPDYGDSRHNSKENLMAYCRLMLAQPLVEKNTKMGLNIEISRSNATVTLVVLTTVDKQSYVYQTFRTLITKTRLQLRRQPDKSWLISSAEILEINRQPAKWRDI